jgi:hypothetical protein
VSAIPKISSSPASISSTWLALRQAGAPSLLAQSRLGSVNGAAGFANGRCLEQAPSEALHAASMNKVANFEECIRADNSRYLQQAPHHVR